MIELCVMGYCHNCPEFEADVTKMNFEVYANVVRYDSVIRCKNRERCEAIKRYLKDEEK